MKIMYKTILERPKEILPVEHEISWEEYGAEVYRFDSDKEMKIKLYEYINKTFSIEKEIEKERNKTYDKLRIAEERIQSYSISTKNLFASRNTIRIIEKAKKETLKKNNTTQNFKRETYSKLMQIANNAKHLKDLSMLINQQLGNINRKCNIKDIQNKKWAYFNEIIDIISTTNLEVYYVKFNHNNRIERTIAFRLPEDITIRYRFKTYNLGRLLISIASLNGSTINIYPPIGTNRLPDPNGFHANRPTYFHPHVNGYKMCTGRNGDKIRKYLEAKNIDSLISFIGNLLSIYNPHSPHCELDQWKGTPCRYCQTTITTHTPSTTCCSATGNRNRNTCLDCLVKIGPRKGCGCHDEQLICEKCANHPIRKKCTSCKEYLCREHRISTSSSLLRFYDEKGIRIPRYMCRDCAYKINDRVAIASIRKTKDLNIKNVTFSQQVNYAFYPKEYLKDYEELVIEIATKPRRTISKDFHQGISNSFKLRLDQDRAKENQKIHEQTINRLFKIESGGLGVTRELQLAIKLSKFNAVMHTIIIPLEKVKCSIFDALALGIYIPELQAFYHKMIEGNSYASRLASNYHTDMIKAYMVQDRRDRMKKQAKLNRERKIKEMNNLQLQ